MPRSEKDMEMLRAAVAAKTEAQYMTPAQTIEHYRERYGAGWTRKISEDLYGLVKNRAGENVSVKNIQRRFQGQRLASAGAGRSAAVYQQLARKEDLTTGRRLPEGQSSITITVQGSQKASRRAGPRPRSVTATFSGPAAYDFINAPDYSDIWEDYGVDAGLFDDGDYAIEVASVS
jgi:hypothetical protein